MKKIKAGIIGATGYAGVELCRLILGHPQAALGGISSVSFTGKPLSAVYPAFRGICDRICQEQEAVIDQSDVIFAAVPHGLSQPIAKCCMEAGKVFIDLGADFRLAEEADYQTWYQGSYDDPQLHQQAAYGLPECFREKIRGKRLVANPGCYTTAVPLALYPALEAGLLETQGIVADCKSGVTGAGRSPSQNTHFPELNENFYAYKAATHRHTPEIEQSLRQITGEAHLTITFVPHLLPVSRGILATCYAQLKPGVTAAQLEEAYRAHYQDEYFIRMLPMDQSPQLRSVRYTNLCEISFTVDRRTGRFIAISAIDNMVKGAAGQAVQNMNLCMGFDEKAGLTGIPPGI